MIERYAPAKSILGVCLGEQAIGQVLGAKLINLQEVYHGISSVIDVVADEPLFKGMGNPFMGGCYHSWVVNPENLPECLEVTAIERESRQIMALRHKEYDVKGIQFHPESVLTPNGKTIIENWLKA